MPRISFSTIDHKTREQLGLGLLEYCLADLIYNLCNNPRSVHQGWCYAKKQVLADNISTSRRTVHDLLNKLEEKGLIERDLETKFIRITVKWYDNVVVTRTVASHSEKNLHTSREETSHHIYDNNTDNDNNVSKKTELKNPDKIDFYANKLVEILNDKKSRTFYRIICGIHDPAVFLQKAAEITKDGGAKNPGAVFTKWYNSKYHSEKIPETDYTQVPVKDMDRFKKKGQ